MRLRHCLLNGGQWQQKRHGHALKEVVERDCGVSTLGDFQNPGQQAPADPT